MNRLLIISTLIILTSCGHSTKSDNIKQTERRTESLASIETTKVDQKTEKEESVENVECSDIDFNSAKHQADSLLAFYNKATDSSLKNRIKWEEKFFCAFPNSFKEMQALFGYDDENGAAPLYSTENNTYSYTDQNIMSDVIGFFSELKSIPDSTYYEKYIRINIDGYWEADNINEAFGFYYRLMNDIESACRALGKFTDREIQSVFHFIFDGPHPENDYNEKLYKNLKPGIDSQNKRLSRLLTESYVKLMAEDDSHGH
ncbi:hypothetical protein ACFQ0R_11860 [Psychroflexus salinarum]|uniref:DUF4375 domain-containing protein n=1 Tax=Psychroflexus salinarum TaxID=546024 RepID=A0ABW3GRN5_9FLAO